jgi:signal transduction histidine kinase
MHNSFAKPLEINLSEKYGTKDYISYTIAEELNETVNDLENRTWTKDKKNFNTSKYANNAYWAKLKIKNIKNFSQTYYLKAENQFTYKIDYYLLKDKSIVNHIEDGVTSKNFNRSFNTNHMLFPLYIEANSEVEVYFKIRNYNKININFCLVSKDNLLDYYQTYNLLEGMFFGGMLLMMLYNLFIYFLLQIRAYLYYVAYVLCLSIYFVGLFGFSQRYFDTYTYLFYLSSGAFFIFLTLFVQSILNLKDKLPTIHKVLNFFILYFLITTLINIYILESELFLYAQLLFNVFFSMIFIFVLIIIGSTYYLAYTKNDIIAKFYSIIWSIMAIIGLVLPLQYLNIIHISLPSDYIFQFLILIEALFFSFILAYKINLMEREKVKQGYLLIQQSKLSSMGEVITMIAHQWRQPLSEINGIVLNLDIDYQKKQLPQQKFTNYLDSIETTTEYMTQTIEDFMNYFKHNK